MNPCVLNRIGLLLSATLILIGLLSIAVTLTPHPITVPPYLIVSCTALAAVVFILLERGGQPCASRLSGHIAFALLLITTILEPSNDARALLWSLSGALLFVLHKRNLSGFQCAVDCPHCFSLRKNE